MSFVFAYRRRLLLLLFMLFDVLFFSVLIAQTVTANTVFFGRYIQEQVQENSGEEKYLDENGDFSNGEATINGVRYGVNNDRYYKEAPIEWNVIKDEGDSLVLLSKYILAYCNFRDVSGSMSVFWDESVLRRFLNNDFYNKAFTSSEQAQIIPTTVSTEEYTYESIYINGDEKSTIIATTDKVFALSKEEIREGDYSFGGGILKGIPSPYLSTTGSPANWYLRGPCGWNSGNQTILFVDADENIDWWYGTESYGVRPCIRVRKSAVKNEKEPVVDPVVDESILPAPKLQIKMTAYNAVKVSWNKQSGVAKYVLYMKTGSGAWKKLKTTTASSTTIERLTAGKKYSFRAIPYSISGKKGSASNIVSVVTLSKIKISSVKKKSGKVVVSWSVDPGADGYEISVSTKKGKYSTFKNINKKKTKSAKLSVTSGKKLFYSIRSWKKNGSRKIYGPRSAQKSFTLKKSSVSTVQKYTVTYNANGGQNAPTKQTKIKGKTIQLRKSVPTRAGYSFLGWAKSKNGSVIYKPGADYDSNKSITLFAKWRKAPKSQGKNRIYGCIIAGCNSEENGYTVHGATDFYNKLIANKLDGYSISPKVKKHIVRDSAPLRSDIESWIIEDLISAQEEDISFVYYSGHGYRKDGAAKGSGICLKDNDYSSYYGFSEFIDFLDKNVDGMIILIVDSCFSEGFIIAAEKNNNIKNRICVMASSKVEQKTASTYKFAMDLSVVKFWEMSMMVQMSIVDKLSKKVTQYNCFTYALMDGLNWNKKKDYPANDNDDQIITCQELRDYIVSKISSIETPQIPCFYLGQLSDQPIFGW